MGFKESDLGTAEVFSNRRRVSRGKTISWRSEHFTFFNSLIHVDNNYQIYENICCEVLSYRFFFEAAFTYP